MIIAVDIDNTLCEPVLSSKDSQNCLKVKPYPNVVQLVRNLKNKGHTIILFTHRHSCTRKATKQWLKDNNIPYDKLVMNKIKYDLLIDDKALPPLRFFTTKMVEQYIETIKRWDWSKGKFRILKKGDIENV